LVNQNFNSSGLTQLIDNKLGIRVKTVGYSYSGIIRNQNMANRRNQL